MDEKSQQAFLAALQGSPEMQAAVANFVNTPAPSLVNDPIVQEGFQEGIKLGQSLAAGTINKIPAWNKDSVGEFIEIPGKGKARVWQSPGEAGLSRLEHKDNIYRGFKTPDEAKKYFENMMGPEYFPDLTKNSGFMGSIQSSPDTHRAVQEYLNRPQNSLVNDPDVQDGFRQGIELGMGFAGTIAKAPSAAAQVVKGVGAASRALPARTVGQGVGLIDTAPKTLGKTIVKMNQGGFPDISELTRLPGLDSPMVQLPTSYAMPPEGIPASLPPVSARDSAAGLDMFNAINPNPTGFADSGALAVQDIVLPLQDPTGPAIMPQAPQSAPAPSARGGAGPFEQMKQANTQIANAESDLASAQADAYRAQANQSQQMMQQFMQRNQELSAERESFIKDIQDSHIDPSRYMHSMNAGAKISTAIGLLLGGLSTAAENPAVKFLNQQIDRDIEAQKADMNKKQNLLAYNLQHFGNLRDATNMTRIMHNDYIKSLVDTAAAKAGTPIAQANAKKLNAQLDMASAQLQAQIALSGPPPADDKAFADRQRMLQRIDPKKAEAEASTRVPGMGNALTKEDAKELKELKATVGTAQSGIKDLLNLSSKYTMKSINPSAIAEADAIRTSLIGLLRVPLTGPGAMSDGERKMLQDVIRNPTSIFSLDSSTKAALTALSKRLDKAVQSQAQARGIDGGQQTPSAIKSFKPIK